MQSTNSEYGSPYLAISHVLSFSFLSLCILCNAMCLCCLRLKNTLSSTYCTLLLLLYAPQACDGNVTLLTILWCHVWREDTKTIKPIINEAFVASSGDMITDYNDSYYGAVECLNLIGWRTFWGVQLFSGKRTANVVPGSFLDRITVLYHFAKWFLLFQRSCNRKITKTHYDTGQTNKYSKQKDKIDRSGPWFCHKITFYYVRKAHSLLPLSRSRSLPHRHIYSLHTP